MTMLSFRKSRFHYPESAVKFLVAAIVVSPLIETAPKEVLNGPVELEASKVYAPEDSLYPVIFCSAPALVSLEVLPVNNEPVDKLRLATLAPLLLRMVKVEVEPCCRSSVVDPPVKETLVSAILISLKVLVPLKVWVSTGLPG